MRNCYVNLTLILVGLLLATSGSQAGVYVTLVDSATDSIYDDIPTSTAVTFKIMMDNDAGENVTGVSNGIRVYSPTGAVWQTPIYVMGDSLSDWFDFFTTINGYSVDGSGADTIGVAAMALASPGVPDGYTGLELFRISTMVSDTYRGDTLCIDSSFYPPNAYWEWAVTAGGVTPSWGGPYCYAIVAPLATIAGTKFHDENGNSVWEPGLGEGVLDNVTINLHGSLDAGGTVDLSTVTDAQGDYLFSGLTPGDYWVVEEVESWWAAQTYPLTVFHTVTDVQWGDNITDLNFGNDTLCNGSASSEICLNGTEDNFNGPEPSNISPGLLTFMQTQYDYITDFDQPANNQAFGHTFEGCWDDDCVVVGATLRIKLRGSAGGTGTDWMAFGDYSQGNNGRIWSMSLNNIDAHFGGDGVWNYNEVAEFTFNLANLPPRPGWLPTNILAALQDGNLDIVVSDDTEVDFIEIEVELCCPDTCYADGDANGDAITLATADLGYLMNFINGCGPAPVPLYSCDLTGDGYVNQADIDLFNSYFIYGMSVFTNGYPVPCPCDPIAEPVPDTVNIFGMEHVSSGTVCLDTTGGVLAVSRISENQCDTLVDSNGDTIIVIPPPVKGRTGERHNQSVSNLGNAGIVWSVEYEVDSTLDVGASLQAEVCGFVDGDSGQVIASVVQTKQVDDSWALGVKTAATSYTVKAYLGGELVWSESDIAASGEWFQTGVMVVGGGTRGSTQFRNVIAAGGGTSSSGDATMRMAPGGEGVWSWGTHGVSDMLIDALLVKGDAGGTVDVGEITYVVQYAMNMESYTIASESYGVDYKGLTVTNLGNAVLTPVDTTLVVSNCGATGNDGAHAEADQDDGNWSMVKIVIENPNGAIPVGATIKTAFSNHRIGFPPPEPIDPFAMAISMTKAAASTWNLGVESDGSLYSIAAYRNDALVFSVDSVPDTNLGYFVEASKGVFPIEFKGSSTGKPASIIAWQDPSGAEWTWAAYGVSALTVDAVSVTIEDFTTAGDSLASATVTLVSDELDGWPTAGFTILDIQTEPGGSCAGFSVCYPDTHWLFEAYALDPSLDTIYCGNFVACSADDIDTSTIRVNESIVPISIELLDADECPPAVEFAGRVLRLEVPTRDLVQSFGWLIDTDYQQVYMSGRLVSGVPCTAVGQVLVFGHVPGDVNSDGSVDIADLVYLVDFMFNGGPAPPFSLASDLDGSCSSDIADLVYLVDYMFSGGPPPVSCP